jgi:cupin 2 domain-containing protein
MQIPKKNLFADLPRSLPAEQIESLAVGDAFKLERITSTAHATPDGQWYDQDTDEWVALLRGSAGLRFEGDSNDVVMHPGDYLLIPAHRRHRVEWTDPHEPTVWLALHYRPHSRMGPQTAEAGS